MTSASILRPYTKPFLTVENQLKLLESRSMEIGDVREAHSCLERIGYYRLSGYWYPYRKSHVSTNPVTGALLLHPKTGKVVTIVEDDFRPGTSFKQVMDLYVFDKRFRLLLLDALERVEVALRVDVALLLGERDAWAHLDPTQLHLRFQKVENGGTHYQRWLARTDHSFRKSKDKFVEHFKLKYTDPSPPLWIAIELWDFGTLSIFLSNLKHADLVTIATKYEIPRADLLISWVRNLNHIRNICAHHSRLWNKSPADQIGPPRRMEIPALNHLVTSNNACTRVYGSVAVLQYFLNRISPMSTWSDRLKRLCSTFPTSTAVNIRHAGFQENWKDLPLWKS